MKELENFPREYERVFSRNERTNKKCDINKVSPLNNIPKNTTEYVNLYKESFRIFEKVYYDFLVKYLWLSRRFCYDGSHRKKFNCNGMILDLRYGVFIRNHIGYDSRSLFGQSTVATRVISYLDDFYPNFNEGNPFEENFEYPYKYMNLECLSLIYTMDERLELLKYGEENKMKYTEFLDYVLNYISCYNEKYGDKYVFLFTRSLPNVKKINRKKKN
ncbi:MAG: hypothetical protein WCW29_04370 [Candidatus Paceibacterota bacterium]|jgi:hypothetical protein